MRKGIKKVQTAKWPTSRKLRPIGSTSQISFNKSSRRGHDDSARNETLRTAYKSIKSNNTQLAQCYQSECLKSANLAEELVAMNQQLMDSVMENSVLKAQISKCERLKKVTQKRIDDMVNKVANCYRTMQLRFSEMESLYLDFTQEMQSVKDILVEEMAAPSEISTANGDSVVSPEEPQNHRKTAKIQKIQPSIGEFRVRDPVILLQRIESAPLSVSSSSDGEEQGDVTLENVGLPNMARRQERRRSTMFVPRRLPKRIVSLSPDQNNRTIPESSPNEVPEKLPESKVILKKLSTAEIEQFTPKKWTCQEKNGSSPKEVTSPIVPLKRNRNLKHVPAEVEKPTYQKLQFPEKNESLQKSTLPKVFLRSTSMQEIDKSESPIKRNKTGYSTRKSTCPAENIIDKEVVEVSQPTDPQFNPMLEEVENIAETLSDFSSSLAMKDFAPEVTLISDDNISSRLNSTYTVDVPLINGTAEPNNVEPVTEHFNVDAASKFNCSSWGDLVSRPNHLPFNDPLEGTSSLYIKRKSRGRKAKTALINDTPEKISRKIKSSDEKDGNSKNVATKRISTRQRRTPKRFLLAQSEKCQVVSVNNETEDFATEAKNDDVHETPINTNDVAEDYRTEDSEVERTVFAAPTIIDDTLFGSPKLSRNPGRRRAMSETIVSIQEIEVIVPPRRAKSRMSYKEAKLNSKLRQPPT